MLVGSVAAAVASIETRCRELEEENGNLQITVETLATSEKRLATQLKRCESQRDRAQEILDALEVERMTRMEEDQATDDARMEELTAQFTNIQHRLEKKIAERDRQIEDLQKQLQSATSRPTPLRLQPTSPLCQTQRTALSRRPSFVDVLSSARPRTSAYQEDDSRRGRTQSRSSKPASRMAMRDNSEDGAFLAPSSSSPHPSQPSSAETSMTQITSNSSYRSKPPSPSPESSPQRPDHTQADTRGRVAQRATPARPRKSVQEYPASQSQSARSTKSTFVGVVVPPRSQSRNARPYATVASRTRSRSHPRVQDSSDTANEPTSESSPVSEHHRHVNPINARLTKVRLQDEEDIISPRTALADVVNGSFDSEEDLSIDDAHPPGTVSKKRTHHDSDDEYEPPTKKGAARPADHKRAVATPHTMRKKKGGADKQQELQNLDHVYGRPLGLSSPLTPYPYEEMDIGAEFQDVESPLPSPITHAKALPNPNEFAKGQLVLVRTYFPSQLRTDREGLPGALATWEGPFKVLDMVKSMSSGEPTQWKLDISLGPDSKPWLASFPASRLRHFTGARGPEEYRREVVSSLRYGNNGQPRKAIETIVAQMKHGKGLYFLIRWEGYGVERMEWKTRSDVNIKLGKKGREILKWWESVLADEPNDSDEA
ncbi:uncharacterized protein STEHIDRAFT_108882 [Stereum hirsutum FP-91666 SS1]|uniref:uncharacterized protein n=1 Tax=Stereum hirsutum (strain FP-91666) TaxID=721885 RepID=UPI000440F011|nr:uncharacterized protein STEHIDRAFT_108882 [Stereum hirsutum FP-91666 SS1]EIM90364.1 hypothetical protein STEHIDRAFT_108882 [Stereum hirsutum FP-91666 SS1]